MCSEKTDWKCLLRISAFCFGSVKGQPLNLSPGIVELSFFLCLEFFRVCPVVLFWFVFYGDDLFYVIPVCLSHLSLDKLFF